MMAFDLSTAVEDAPAAQPRKFDLSTAQPEQRPTRGPGQRHAEPPEESYLDEYGRGVREAGENAAAADANTRVPLGLRTLTGAAEAGASLLTGALAPVPGAIKSALTGQPYTEARDSYTYEPRSAPGQAVLQTVGAVAKPAVDVFEGAAGGVGSFAEMLGASPEAAEQISAATM